MNEILGEVFRAAGILLGAGLIMLVYSMARDLTKDSDKGMYTCLLIGLAVSAVFGFFYASSVGQPTCLDSDTDNRGTTCSQYADDGYVPSTEKRISVFAFWFTVTVVPIILGVPTGYNERKEKDQK